MTGHTCTSQNGTYVCQRPERHTVGGERIMHAAITLAGNSPIRVEWGTSYGAVRSYAVEV